MNITEIIPTDLSGYCDVESGECITTETGTGHPQPCAGSNDAEPRRAR